MCVQREQDGERLEHNKTYKLLVGCNLPKRDPIPSDSTHSSLHFTQSLSFPSTQPLTTIQSFLKPPPAGPLSLVKLSTDPEGRSVSQPLK